MQEGVVVEAVAFLVAHAQGHDVEGRDHVHAAFPRAERAKEVGAAIVKDPATGRACGSLLQRAGALAVGTIQPQGESVTWIGRTGNHQLFEEVFPHDLLSLPLAELQKPLPIFGPIACRDVAAVGNVRVAGGIVNPLPGLHADRIEDALLQVVERGLLLRRQHALHDFSQRVVAARSILKTRSRFPHHWDADRVLVKIRREGVAVLALQLLHILDQACAQREEMAQRDAALAWVIRPLGQGLGSKFVERFDEAVLDHGRNDRTPEGLRGAVEMRARVGVEVVVVALKSDLALVQNQHGAAIVLSRIVGGLFEGRSVRREGRRFRQWRFRDGGPIHHLHGLGHRDEAVLVPVEGIKKRALARLFPRDPVVLVAVQKRQPSG